MVTLTDKDRQFIDAIRAIVAETGEDHVYERIDDGNDPHRSCWYVHDGQPSCLIGRALHRIGVPLDLLARNEGTSALSLMEDIGGFSYTVRLAADLAQDVQDGQDKGNTWGDALRVFDHRLFAVQGYSTGDGS